MRTMNGLMVRGWRLLAIALVFALALAGCAPVKLVADSDAEAVKQITAASGEVLGFYDTMLTDAGGSRNAKLPYDKYKESWSKIETRLRVITVQEEARPLNESSTKISEAILGFVEKYRAMHQKSDNYVLNPGDNPVAVLRSHRDRFQRQFVAALAAEKAKLLAQDETDPAAGDSKK